MTKPMISVDNVHKSYLMGKEAVPALRGVSLEIEQGDFV
jgi:ABC-type lipoprotein export system ATPase subunit